MLWAMIYGTQKSYLTMNSDPENLFNVTAQNLTMELNWVNFYPA